MSGQLANALRNVPIDGREEGGLMDPRSRERREGRGGPADRKSTQVKEGEMENWIARAPREF